MAPETGAMIQSAKAEVSRLSVPVRGSAVFSGSETEGWQVTVANRNAAAGGQQAVDGGHQAAEQGAGGQEADRCSLGHGVPFSCCGTIPLRDLGVDYVYQMPVTTGLFA